MVRSVDSTISSLYHCHMSIPLGEFTERKKEKKRRNRTINCRFLLLQAGFKVGDYIISINDNAIKNAEDPYDHAVGLLQKSGPLKIEVLEGVVDKDVIDIGILLFYTC